MLNQERLEQAFQRLQNYPQRGAGLDRRFHELISTADDDDLNRINAYRLAEDWGQPVQDLLGWLLYAAYLGMFELHWESYCPACNGVNESFATAGDLSHEMTCGICHHHYGIHLDENIQVTFSISPAIRQTQPTIKSLGPLGTVIVGEYDTAEPFEVVFDHALLYFFVSGQEKRPFVVFVVSDDQPPVESLTVDYTQDEARFIPVQRGRTRIQINNTDHVVLGYRDNDERFHKPHAKGLEVALLPAFQQLFASKTLSQRESLSIRSLTILFTDITGSTALYQRLGDVVAYNLVRDHFEVLFREIARFQSGVVKTIGDAVMAAFITPEEAVQAALAVQAAFHEFNRDRSLEDGQILVKIGIHTGSAIAVHLNERLDYFGNMVNMAARIQGQSRSAEILLSEAVYGDPAVQETLAKTPSIRVSESLFELSGIEQAQRLFSLATVVE